jgi:ATP-binding cassette subfamily B protein
MTVSAGDRMLIAVALRGWAWLATLGCISIASLAAGLILPAAVGHVVDAAIDGTASGGWLAVCAVLIIMNVAADAVTTLAGGAAIASATAHVRELLAAHVLAVGNRLTARPRLGEAAGPTASAGLPGQPPADAAFSVGDTVSRVLGGAADAGSGPTSMLTSVIAAIAPIGGIVALLLIDPWLAASFAIVFPALAITLRRLARDSTQVSTDYGRVQGAIAARLLDALAGARTIAAAGTQDLERQRILAPLQELRTHGYAAWRVQARAATQGMTIAPALQLIVVAVAGLELSRHRITPGELVAAIQYAGLAAGIGASAGLIAQLGRARGAARRAAELLALPTPRYGEAVLPLPEAFLGQPLPGELRLSGVTALRGGEKVLRDLDLTIPGGACVALVGKSGAGKSTLAELAGRLADPDAGRITLDGTDLREIARASLRTAIVYAFERPHLFGATPGEAISFGVPVPPPGQLAMAAEDAQAAAFITRLPGAFEARLPDTRLSGGEVQRLGLARAFAHAGGARLVILDDATSSLDTVTEMLVSRALTGRLCDRTRLIIAHRAATAARADLVAWLEGGKIRAVAPHEALWLDADYRGLFGC